MKRIILPINTKIQGSSYVKISPRLNALPISGNVRSLYKVTLVPCGKKLSFPTVETRVSYYRKLLFPTRGTTVQTN